MLGVYRNIAVFLLATLSALVWCSPNWAQGALRNRQARTCSRTSGLTSSTSQLRTGLQNYPLQQQQQLYALQTNLQSYPQQQQLLALQATLQSYLQQLTTAALNPYLSAADEQTITQQFAAAENALLQVNNSQQLTAAQNANLLGLRQQQAAKGLRGR
jgi:hypothetical protein